MLNFGTFGRFKKRPRNRRVNREGRRALSASILSSGIDRWRRAAAKDRQSRARFSESECYKEAAPAIRPVEEENADK